MVVYTARGAATSAGDLAGPALGALARRVLAGFPLRRLIVAGGDTSGTVMRAIGGDGLEYLGFVGRSCALCRLHADGQGIDGLQVVLKGGQLGGRDFFEQVRLGAG